MENLSRQERNSWYIPGKTEAEIQHCSEHETLQILQRLALNGQWGEYEHLIMTKFKDADKRKIKDGDLCKIYNDVGAVSYTHLTLPTKA